MKISECIELLKKYIDKYGDGNLYLYSDFGGGELVNHINHETLDELENMYYVY